MSILSGNSILGQPARRAAAQVAPADVRSVLGEIGALTGGTLSRVGSALSAPDDYLRGALVGRPGERVDGWDLLQSMGVIDENPGWGGFALGLATDIATSPSTYLLGPAQSLTKAGTLAKRAGLLDSAATSATRKAIASGLDNVALPRVARNTRAALEATGRNISQFDPAVVGRPLYGTRTARRTATLDDLVKYADDQKAALESLQRAAASSGDDLAELGSETLSKSFGIGAPFGDPLSVGDWLGKDFGDRYADVLDTAGQAFRWSAPGRWTAAAFDSRVGGATNAEEQIVNAAQFAAGQRRSSQAVREHTEQLARMQLRNPDVFSPEGNRALGRYLEGVPTAEDVAYVESREGVKAYADWWKAARDVYRRNSERLGLPLGMTSDPYGIEYLPRVAHRAMDMDGFAGDLMGRTSAMQVPGGRDTIMDLSQDSVVSGPARQAKTDEEAAAHIMQRLNQMVGPDQPPIEMEQARKLARIFHRLPNEATAKAPLFSQHPADMIGSYVDRRAGMMARTETLYDSLATMTAGAPSSEVVGGRHISIEEALKRLNLETHTRDTLSDAFEVIEEGGARTVRDIRPDFGAKQQMRRRLAQLTGMAEDKIELSQFSVPEDHVMRLARGAQAFSTDEAASALINWLDHYTVAWRGSILAWPARAVRDLYSGAVQNWMAGATDGMAVVAAKGLMNEGAGSQSFLKYLSSIPRYAGDDGVAQFYADLASTRLVQGGAVSDVAGATLGERALDALPGARQINASTILGEFAPQQGRTWRQFGADFGTWRSRARPLDDTMNPVMRASEQINSLTDGVNRISGFLALMKQGMEPDAAAKAIKAVQVDYSTLTSFERNWLKSIFPWYSFQSRMFRTVLKELVERPGGRYGHLIRGTEAVQGEGNENTYVPSALRSQFAFPLPKFLGGQPSADTQVYLTDLDFPGFDQINMIETPGTLSGTVGGTARQVAMQTHPVLRSLIELGTGQDLFSRRPLKEATTSTDAILRGITGDRTARVPGVLGGLVRLAENAPFVARPLGLARQLADTRGDRPLSSRALTSGVNALSGVKMRTVAREDVLADAVRQIEESIDPYTREFQQTFIPEDELLNVPDYALRRLAVSRQLGKERRDLMSGR